MTPSPLMSWLAAGVPITLLCDLVATGTPDSVAINAAERPAGDPVWLETAVAQTALGWWQTG